MLSLLFVAAGKTIDAGAQLAQVIVEALEYGKMIIFWIILDASSSGIHQRLVILWSHCVLLHKC